jgi:single-stranded DNA-binding protein
MSFDERALAVADRLVKGARLYVEGQLRLDEWTGSDGAKRHGLSVISWHTRLTQIGRNRPKRTTGNNIKNNSASAAPANDEIPF